MRAALAAVLGSGGHNPATDPLLYDGWWTEAPSTLTVSGGLVSEWRTIKNAYAAVQATEAARPAYGATGFNGRPVVTGDGVDDFLSYEGVGNFPTGATPREIVLVIDQPALPADTTQRTPFSYGSNLNAGTVQVQRLVASGVNRGRVIVGDGASSVAPQNASADFSGRCLVRCIIEATRARIDINGVEGSWSDVVPATGSVRTRLFASTAGSVASFWGGGAVFEGVYQRMTDAQWAERAAFWNARL